MSMASIPRLDELPVTERLLVDERAEAFLAALARNEAVEPRPYLDDLSGPARAVLLREMLLEHAEWQRGRLDLALLRTYEEAVPDHIDLIRTTLGDDRESASSGDPKTGSSDSTVGAGPVAATSQPAATIPGYELAELLGHGGTADVYRAYHLRLCRWVAIKLPRLSVAEIPPEELRRARTRFRREARVQAQVGTAGVPAVFEFGRTDDGLPFIAMEAVEGPTLDVALLDDAVGLNASPTRLRQVAGLCRTLASAHALGIRHLDFKPQNIRFTLDGLPKILDWGFGRWSAEPGSASTDPATDRQGETDGRLGGTPGYLAPEQARHEWDRLTGRTDTFSVGVLLLRVITGRGLFPAGTTLDEVMARTAEGRFDEALIRLEPTVPLSDLIVRCLRPEPDDRPTVADVAVAIDAYLEQREAEDRRLREEQRTREIREAERTRRRRLLLTSAVTLTLVTGLAGWQWWAFAADRAERRARDDARILATISSGQTRISAALAQRSIDPTQASAALDLLREGLLAAERAESAAEFAGPLSRETFRRYLAESGALLVAEQRRVDRLAAESAAAARDRRLSARIIDAFDFDEGMILGSLLGNGNPDPFRFDARLMAALRDCGITPVTLADDRSLEELAARPASLRDELALALEIWGLDLKNDDPARAKILAAADRIDPDPARREIRAVLADYSLMIKNMPEDFVGPPRTDSKRERLLAFARAARDPRSDPPSLVALSVAVALIANQEEKAGLDLLRAVAARRPDSPTANWFAASFIAKYEPSGYFRAAPYYQALRALRPSSGFTMVVILVREGRGWEAETILDEIERHRGPSTEVDLYRAILLMNQALWDRDRIDEAVALTARVVQRRPENSLARGFHAMFLLKPRRIKEAAHHAAESIRLDPRESLGHYVLGSIALMTKNLAEAEAEFRAAIRLDEMPPAYPNAMLALCLASRGLLAEAQPSLELAHRLEPTDPMVQAIRAVILAQMGRDAEAQAICDGILAGRDDQVLAHMARLVLAIRARNWVAAEAAALIAIRLEPEEPTLYTLLISTLNQLGEVDRIITTCARSAEIEPGNLVNRQIGATARLMMGDLAGAEAEARAALQIAPQSSDLHRLLASALVRSRRYDEAVESSDRAIRGTFLFTPARRAQTEEHANLVRIRALVPRLREVVAGRVEPNGEPDLLCSARLATYEEETLASSDLYQRAFAAASKPLAQSGHMLLLPAIRQTVLAADRPDTPNDRRHELRERARQWLAMELDRLRSRDTLGKLSNPDVVCQTVRLWQVYPGLDPVRNPARRGELPDVERSAWTTLWDDVESTRQQARALISIRKPRPVSTLEDDPKIPAQPTAPSDVPPSAR